MTVLLIREPEIEQLITLEESIECVEEAFRSRGSGSSQMPPKSYVFLEKFNGDFRVMPAYLEEVGAAGVKIVNSHPDNPRKNNLPSVMAIIVLLEPETGEPISIMSATKITDFRTGAAGAVAAKYLARENSKKVGMIGTGAQAKSQLLGLNQIFDLDEVKAYSKFEESRDNFINSMKNILDFKIISADSARSAVSDSDIVVTTTPSKNPIVRDDWVSEGTHINAIGADAKNKQELDPSILKRAKVVVDEWDQASHSGEISVSVSDGEFSKKDLFAEIGDVVTGNKQGRTSEEDITIFDSTGLAVQDISTAWKIYEKAQEEGKGEEVDFLSLEE